MASDGSHADILLGGPKAWNQWRESNPTVTPDLRNLQPTLNQRQMGAVNGGPVNFHSALLQNAFLRYATLSRADLSDANLTNADLAYARLDSASLQNANLSGAVLDHADFAQADLSGANLQGASLKNALNLTQEQVDSCLGDNWTALPSHLTQPRRWEDTRQSVFVEQRREEQTTANDVPPREMPQRWRRTSSLMFVALGALLGLGLLTYTLLRPAPVPADQAARQTSVPVIMPAAALAPTDDVTVTASITPSRPASLKPNWLREIIHAGHAVSVDGKDAPDEAHATLRKRKKASVAAARKGLGDKSP